MERRSYVCIECGNGVRELYKEYECGIIKLKHCINCDKIVDKYVEFDAVLILLDVLLFKPQAFRHILCNISVQFHWKLCVICVLCHSYLKWALMHQPQHLTLDDNKDDDATKVTKSFLYYALQIDFYLLFLQAIFELIAYSAGIVAGIMLYGKISNAETSTGYDFMQKAVILSQSGYLLVIPAVIWGQSNIVTSFWLTKLFIYTFISQALKVLLDCSRFTTLALLTCGSLAEMAVPYLLGTPPDFVLAR